MAGGDVEKAEFVGARRVIGLRGLDRIAGIDQIDELHALDDAAILDIETGNETDLEHHAAPFRAASSASAAAGSMRPS